MPVAVSKRRFTADDYCRMAEVGILSPRDRVELVDGEVVTMSPIGPRHGAAVARATRALVTQARDAAIVRVQSPVRLDFYTQPEPDVVLARPRADFYATAHPGAADVLLIVEVAEWSIDYDLEVKAPLYARNGVPEYWVVDLNENRVLCHSEPADGAYRKVRTCGRGEPLAPLLLPACVIRSDELILQPSAAE
jgi:Uma2 family endonuclease